MRNHERARARKRAYVAEWDSKALHGVAMMLNRLSESEDLTERQEWLWHRVIDELEYRYLRDIRERPWEACTCALCFSPFPAHDPQEEADHEDHATRQSRPDGAGITRRQHERPTQRDAQTEHDDDHGFVNIELPFDWSDWPLPE